MSEPTKQERIIAALNAPEGALRSNASIAAEVGCDEGMVRRSRPLAELHAVRAELAEANEKLKKCTCLRANLRRRRKHDPACPLFECCQ